MFASTARGYRYFLPKADISAALTPGALRKSTISELRNTPLGSGCQGPRRDGVDDMYGLGVGFW
jgi:hypothetical protein